MIEYRYKGFRFAIGEDQVTVYKPAPNPSLGWRLVCNLDSLTALCAAEQIGQGVKDLYALVTGSEGAVIG